MKKLKEYFPYLLLLIYIGLLIRSGINPVDRWVWYAEEWTVLVVVLILVFTFKKFRFSNLAYLMMFAWIVIHTIWGHYTFEKVPFDRFNNLFGFERNMYDRVGHFIIGFYAFPIIELLDRKKMVNNRVILFKEFWKLSWQGVLNSVFAFCTLGETNEIVYPIVDVVVTDRSRIVQRSFRAAVPCPCPNSRQRRRPS